MKTFLMSFLTEQSSSFLLFLIIAFIVFFFFLRREFRYENKKNMELINNQLQRISDLLSNHITDTNKKIEDLKVDTHHRIDGTNRRIDDLRQDMNTLRQDMKEGFREIKEAIKK